MNKGEEQDNLSAQQPGITRREMLIASGVGLVGATLLGTMPGIASGQNTQPATQQAATTPQGLISKDGGTKPVLLPPPGTTDAAILSLAETVFWLDQDMEHAKFFVMLMPPEELSGPRGQAQQFMTQLMAHLDKVRGASIDKSNYVSMNQQTIDLVKPFVDYKRQMDDMQKAGKLNSLVWPTFFEHVAREGEHLIERLTQLNKNTVELDRNRLIDFFARIMDEHALFIAHLLDPTEEMLKSKAEQTSVAFKKLRDQKPGRKGSSDPVKSAVQEIIAFKTTAEKGILAGQIKSIIHPTLADHVRREAVKFDDDLTRAV
jgi:hypothetical protein